MNEKLITLKHVNKFIRLVAVKKITESNRKLLGVKVECSRFFNDLGLGPLFKRSQSGSAVYQLQPTVI